MHIICCYSSGADLLLSCRSVCTELFIAFCRSHVPKWILANAPPATQTQFFLSQLWFLIFTSSEEDHLAEQHLQLLLVFGRSLLALLGQRRQRRWRRSDVRHDARLRNIFLPALLQQWIGFDRVPTPVNQPEARAHNNQHFIVIPKAPEPTHVYRNFSFCFYSRSHHFGSWRWRRR